MVFVSDTQYPWTPANDDGKTQDEETTKSISTTLNTNHVNSINKLIDELKNVKGTIFNGDLTAYGHEW